MAATAIAGNLGLETFNHNLVSSEHTAPAKEVLHLDAVDEGEEVESDSDVHSSASCETSHEESTGSGFAGVQGTAELADRDDSSPPGDGDSGDLSEPPNPANDGLPQLSANETPNLSRPTTPPSLSPRASFNNRRGQVPEQSHPTPFCVTPSMLMLLPDDVLALVAKQLDPPDWRNLRCVSRAWHAACESCAKEKVQPPQALTLSADPKAVGAEVEKLARNQPSMRRLHIKSCQLYTLVKLGYKTAKPREPVNWSACLSHLTAFSSLASLRITSEGSAQYDGITYSLAALSNLRNLTQLSAPVFRPSNFAEIATITSLQHLAVHLPFMWIGLTQPSDNAIIQSGFLRLAALTQLRQLLLHREHFNLLDTSAPITTDLTLALANSLPLLQNIRTVIDLGAAQLVPIPGMKGMGSVSKRQNSLSSMFASRTGSRTGSQTENTRLAPTISPIMEVNRISSCPPVMESSHGSKSKSSGGFLGFLGKLCGGGAGDLNGPAEPFPDHGSLSADQFVQTPKASLPLTTSEPITTTIATAAITTTSSPGLSPATASTVPIMISASAPPSICPSFSPSVCASVHRLNLIHLQQMDITVLCQRQPGPMITLLGTLCDRLPLLQSLTLRVSAVDGAVLAAVPATSWQQLGLAGHDDNYDSLMASNDLGFKLEKRASLEQPHSRHSIQRDSMLGGGQSWRKMGYHSEMLTRCTALPLVHIRLLGCVSRNNSLFQGLKQMPDITGLAKNLVSLGVSQACFIPTDFTIMSRLRNVTELRLLDISMRDASDWTEKENALLSLTSLLKLHTLEMRHRSVMGYHMALSSAAVVGLTGHLPCLENLKLTGDWQIACDLDITADTFVRLVPEQFVKRVQESASLKQFVVVVPPEQRKALDGFASTWVEEVHPGVKVAWQRGLYGDWKEVVVGKTGVVNLPGMTDALDHQFFGLTL